MTSSHTFLKHSTAPAAPQTGLRYSVPVGLATRCDPSKCCAHADERRALQVEEQALKKEGKDAMAKKRLAELARELATLQDALHPLQLRYNKEHARMVELRELQAKRERLREDAKAAQQRNDLARMADLVHGAIPEIDARLRALREELPDDPMLSERIGVEEVAAVVARWTGIPVSRLQQTEVDKLVNLKEELHNRVVGQDGAVAAVADAVLRARAGIAAADRGASFLFLGPTGARPRRCWLLLLVRQRVLLRACCCRSGRPHVSNTLLVQLSHV